ncbi:DUF2567 domain-containing protein [Nocardia sp. NPDC003482]
MAHTSTAEPTRARSPEWRVAGWFTAALLLVSALGGVVWALLAPTEKVVVLEPGRGAALTGESVHRFDAVAVFVCIGAVVGLVSAVAVWRLLRRVRGPIMQCALLFGSLAGAWLMARCGEFVAGQLHSRPDHPAVHTIVEFAPTVTGWTALVVQPLLASLVILVGSALSTSEDLGAGAPVSESSGGRRPYASDVSYGPYGTAASDSPGRANPFQDSDSR